MKRDIKTLWIRYFGVVYWLRDTCVSVWLLWLPVHHYSFMIGWDLSRVLNAAFLLVTSPTNTIDYYQRIEEREIWQIGKTIFPGTVGETHQTTNGKDGDAHPTTSGTDGKTHQTTNEEDGEIHQTIQVAGEIQEIMLFEMD